MPGEQVQSDDEIRAYIRKWSKTDYHPVGSCKMGHDDMAVVDPQLRVRGLEGLWVIDASVMPKLISGNTQAPSIMIGEKGAAMVLDPKVTQDDMHKRLHRAGQTVQDMAAHAR